MYFLIDLLYPFRGELCTSNMCSDPTVITVIRHVIGKPEAVAAPGPALRAFICATAVFTIVLVLDLVHRLTIPLSCVTLHSGLEATAVVEVRSGRVLRRRHDALELLVAVPEPAQLLPCLAMARGIDDLAAGGKDELDEVLDLVHRLTIPQGKCALHFPSQP